MQNLKKLESKIVNLKMEHFFIPLKTKKRKKELLFARYLQKQRVEVFWKNVAHSL